jgi:glycosyltransferase involved in cell wall biosynthesis
MIKNKSILFISTNDIWSGSEELWTRSAKEFAHLGFKVAFATKYNHGNLDALKVNRANFANEYSAKTALRRAFERFVKAGINNKNILRDFILENSPQLVVISQGNNYESIDVMRLCSGLNVPYVTLTQLVAEIFIGALSNNNMLQYAQNAYSGAIKNFFVSNHNLKLHQLLLGIKTANDEVVYNPCKLLYNNIPKYPLFKEYYKVGLVGRIDCFHKGYDLFMQVIAKDKWRRRSIDFNMYGDGPHVAYINSYIKTYGIKNVHIKGYSNHVSKIWEENQLLLLPSRFEGQALALIEAMYCQRAAVVTDVGGASELIEEGISGFIADSPTADSIDAALERAWEQRDSWEQMGLQAAAMLKEKYPVDAVDYFNSQLLKLLDS